MSTSMVKKNKVKQNELEELEKLLVIARSQNDCINLNLIYMTIALNDQNYERVMNYFSDRGITMIQDDIEPDVPAYSSEGEKFRPFDPSKIDITMKPLTLDSLLRRIKNDEIEFDTSFQRKAGLWKNNQKSQLIESIFLRIPLPAFYFDASDDGLWLIIDGLQRVTTLREFVVDKTLTLEEMEFFPELNGCNYDQLPRAFQRRLDETVINVYLVNPATPANVKFNIFKRINTGGLELEPQEIRNALFQGKATVFLQECAKLDSFLSATDGSVKSERMLDREFVLRYVSFCYLNLKDYTGNIDEFLNEGMKYLNCAEDHTLEKIRSEFIYVMKCMRRLMGRNSFRKISRDGRRRPINKAIFESWCYVVKNLSEDQVEYLVRNRDLVQEKYMDLCEDNDYLYQLKAPDRKMVIKRIADIQKLIDSIL